MRLVDPISDTPTPVRAPTWFDRPTWGRRPNLDLVMDYLRSAFAPSEPLHLVEVGSLRTPGNVDGDGCASVAWGTLAKERGGAVVSIDVDHWAVENANRLRRYGLPVFGVVGRAQDVLALLPGPYHLLYLDGSDDPMEALDQLAVAGGKVVPGGVVMVDDFGPDARLPGKGAHIAGVMAQRVREGRARAFDGLDPKWNQAAWIVG